MTSFLKYILLLILERKRQKHYYGSNINSGFLGVKISGENFCFLMIISAIYY